MSKPSAKNSVIVIEDGDFSIRLSRVGKSPVVCVWVHEQGNGGRGMLLDVDQSDAMIEAWQDLLDDIEGGG